MYDGVPTVAPVTVRPCASATLAIPKSVTTAHPPESTMTLAALTSRCTTPCLWARSEEHTSELQSLAYLVCRLLLEKKKKRLNTSHYLISYAVFCLKKKTQICDVYTNVAYTLPDASEQKQDCHQRIRANYTSPPCRV